MKYTTIQGDTFESIARKVYGDDLKAQSIASANPGATEPFLDGVELVVPDDPDAPQNSVQESDSNPDEMGILIDGKRFRFWESFSITRSIDSVSTAAFSCPFDHDKSELRDIFKPFSYKDVTVSVGGMRLFTGTLVDVVPNVESKRKTISASCYSKPGVLSDCTAISAKEYSDQTLLEIARFECDPFGIDVESRIENSPKFERVAVPPTKKFMAFLADLASQRGIIIADTPEGNLVIWEAVDKGNTVATLRQGSSPLVSVTPKFNPQQYYSVITVIQPVSFGSESTADIIGNPFGGGAFRPITFESKDTQDAEIKNVSESKLSRMLANAVSYVVNVSTWRDPQGELWEPNTTIKLNAPDAMIYSDYEFLIKKVVFSASKNSRTASLELVLPESYKRADDPASGYGITIPLSLPWD